MDGTNPSYSVMNGPPGILRDGKSSGKNNGTAIPRILPHEKVFPIQIGNELFRLSGASISSDAPSYFSAFFECQLKEAEAKRKDGEEAPGVRTLYIDRDPVTFGDISRHLQGYHVIPRDGSHFVKLFADAQFYQLPRLVDQLYEEAIYISIGGTEFRIHKDLFSAPGDSPNYFTLGYAFLFSSPGEVFPGLNRDGLLRPPSIMPPAIPNHSAAIFADLVHVLRGYPLHIRNEAHRKELLLDAKYYHFKGVEQKLIPYEIAFNTSRLRDEITLRMEDLRQTGLSVGVDAALPQKKDCLAGWVKYARPYADDKSYDLVVEIGHEWTKLNTATMRLEFFGEGKRRINKLLEVVTSKINFPSPGTPHTPKAVAHNNTMDKRKERDVGLFDRQGLGFIFDQASVVLDGKKFSRSEDLAREEDFGDIYAAAENPVAETGRDRKRRRVMLSSGAGSETVPIVWTVLNGLWRVRIVAGKGIGGASADENGVEFVLVAVKIDAVSGEVARNDRRGFLGS